MALFAGAIHHSVKGFLKKHSANMVRAGPPKQGDKRCMLLESVCPPSPTTPLAFTVQHPWLLLSITHPLAFYSPSPARFSLSITHPHGFYSPSCTHPPVDVPMHAPHPPYHGPRPADHARGTAPTIHHARHVPIMRYLRNSRFKDVSTKRSSNKLLQFAEVLMDWQETSQRRSEKNRAESSLAADLEIGEDTSQADASGASVLRDAHAHSVVPTL